MAGDSVSIRVGRAYDLKDTKWVGKQVRGPGLFRERVRVSSLV